MTAEEIQKLRDTVDNDFFLFAKYITKFQDLSEKFHKRVAGFLVKFYKKSIDGKALALLMLARGHFKSSLGSVALPLYILTKNPDAKILIVSNKQEHTKKWIGHIKDIFERSSLFKALYPELIPKFSKTLWKEDQIIINRPSGQAGEPSLKGVGLESSLTSAHYDYIIVDDIVDKTNIGTAEQRRKIIEYYKTLLSLFKSPDTIRILVMGTTWHYADLYSILRKSEEYMKMIIPAVVDGRPVFPERFSLRGFEHIKKEIGTSLYSAQYLLDPVSREDAVFKPEWIQHYTQLPERRGFFVVTVDPAISQKEESCETGFSVVMYSRLTGKYYIIEAYGKHLTPYEIIDEIIRLYARYQPVYIAIEEVAFQSVLSYILTKEAKERGLYIPVKGVKPKGRSKEYRIYGLQPLFERGDILLRPGLYELERQLLDFPMSEKLDILDSVAYAPELFAEIPGTLRPPKKETQVDRLLRETDPRRNTMSLLEQYSEV